MEGILIIFFWAIGGLILFMIIAGAVKMALKEALAEFKRDLMKDLKELNSKKENE